MKILVCVKQVPDTNDVMINPETGTLQREGVISILNPFCEFALEKALAIKKALPETTIATVTMGPPQAMDVIDRTLWLGADEGYLITDREYAGSDCYATAQVLTSFVKKYIPDCRLILAGKQAIDGDTAQVPAEMAEFLSIPQISYCTEVQSVTADEVIIKAESDNGYELIKAPLPALVTVSQGQTSRSFPTLQAIMDSTGKKRVTLSNDELKCDPARIGVDGSPTRVIKVETPKTHSNALMIKADQTGTNAAEAVFDYLVTHKLITGTHENRGEVG